MPQLVQVADRLQQLAVRFRLSQRSQSGNLALTFRTLFRGSEAISKEPLKREEGALYTNYFMHHQPLVSI